MKKKIFAVFAAAVALAVPATTAQAASTYTQNAFNATVTGTSVSLVANISARPATTGEYTRFCTADSAGATVAYVAPTQTNIPTSGVTIRQTATLPAGTYTSTPCVRTGTSGSWTRIGSAKTFTIASTGPKVLFQDDFNGAAGSAATVTGGRSGSKWTEWSTTTYNSSAAYGEVKPGDRSTLDGNGHLRIPATPTQGTSISTKDNFTFTTGTMSVRMKIPSEKGYWPAFWALNNNPDGTELKPTIGEIDVHESYTGLDKTIHHAVTHNYVTEGNATPWGQDNFCFDNVDLSNDFHTYGVKVEPGSLTYLFDGKVCAVDTKSEGDPNAWSFAPDNNAGLWPILTLAVGGAGGQQDPGTGKNATVPAYLEVDSVTVTSL